MKAAWALVFLAVCTVLVITFQAIKQEINIHRMRNTILSSIEGVKTKEDDILSSKAIMQKLSNELTPLDKEKKQLTKQMQELAAQKETTEKNLNTCQLKKTEVGQQKTERTSAFETLRKNQNEEIQKVKDEVQSLQKQILDRDKNICLHVDKQQQGAMELCVDKPAASNL